MRADNKRIVRNTGLLYFRLIFLTAVNLYTVRITLEALGDVDYGIYSVISSVVAALSILTGAMSSASQRFLAFHLGRDEKEEYSRTFTLLIVAFVGLAAILCLIGEGAGVYFIGGDHLKLAPGRTEAAWWVFQTSLVAFATGLVTIPYSASIIANEKMDAFALFSIVEGVLKLLLVVFLIYYGGDRLILYSILMMGIGLFVLGMHAVYCKMKFRYCKYVWRWDKTLFVKLSGYTGWNLFGSISGVLARQGQNILLNMYFGPLINASKAIADGIRNVVGGFSVNLYMAVSPQIIKAYANGDMERTFNLVLKSSRMSYLLLLVMVFPLICNMEGLLQIWLKQTSGLPDVTEFSQLVLVYSLVFSLESPITRLIQATGDIRRYNVNVGIVTLSFIPIAAIALTLGASPVSTVVVLIILIAIAQVVRVAIAHGQVGLSYGGYMSEVIMPILKTGVVGVPLYMAMAEFLPKGGFLPTLTGVAVTFAEGLFLAGVLGMTKEDRTTIMKLIKEKLNNRK